jgi:hypothetical protein
MAIYAFKSNMPWISQLINNFWRKIAARDGIGNLYGHRDLQRVRHKVMPPDSTAEHKGTEL